MTKDTNSISVLIVSLTLWKLDENTKKKQQKNKERRKYSRDLPTR